MLMVGVGGDEEHHRGGGVEEAGGGQVPAHCSAYRQGEALKVYTAFSRTIEQPVQLI